ncbi:type II restriction endonuclease [Mycoplasmopsis caviae]|uniref:Type-2 restriction enzyme n=1 Tax=Mycoplasmopsis caviae TaxID=55603 RepID=A0A3P8KBF1_9BACT|nr:DpnII family type II restriction endonuclease [Mycoplasmopsis caviae]UUD35307.1 type II restriction endonuclease [Mycoplasmopsis caviae]VDR41914.1 Type-2 restriction enzyme DpnII [Mycoplasmopsis caviae]
MIRDFEQWFKTLTPTIVGYDYYVDFAKINNDLLKYKRELEKFCSIGQCEDISLEFKRLYDNDKNVLKILPSLLAIRNSYLQIYEDQKIKELDFERMTNKFIDYAEFFEKSGLKKWLNNKSNDYVLGYFDGVQVGINSNARKNRTGSAMELLVEKFIKEAGFIEGKTYFKQVKFNKIDELTSLHIANAFAINFNKKFDFIILKENKVYAIEVNFYMSGGSKLNEIIRSYEKLYFSTKDIENFEFVWITDGINGWKTCKNNLRQIFEQNLKIFNINDLNNDVLRSLK